MQGKRPDAQVRGLNDCRTRALRHWSLTHAPLNIARGVVCRQGSCPRALASY